MNIRSTMSSPAMGERPQSQGPQEQEQCPICIEPVEATNWIKTECNHTFHKSCLYIPLVKRSVCPLCNQWLYEGLKVLPDDSRNQSLREVLQALGQKVGSDNGFQKELDQGLKYSIEAYNQDSMDYWLEQGASVPDSAYLKEKYREAVQRRDLLQAQALKNVFPLQLKGIDIPKELSPAAVIEALQRGNFTALEELEALGADIKSIACQNRLALDRLLEKAIQELDPLVAIVEDCPVDKADCAFEATMGIRACLGYGASLTAQAQSELDDKFTTAIEKEEFDMAEQLKKAGAFLRADSRKADETMLLHLQNALEYEKWRKACQVIKLGIAVPDSALPTLNDCLKESLLKGKFSDAENLKTLGARLPEGCEEKELLGQGLKQAVRSYEFDRAQEFLNLGAPVSEDLIRQAQERSGLPADFEKLSALRNRLEKVRMATLSPDDQIKLDNQFYTAVLFGNYADAQHFKNRGARVQAGALEALQIAKLDALQTAKSIAEKNKDTVILDSINSLIDPAPAESHSGEVTEAASEKQVSSAQAELDEKFHSALKRCNYGEARRWQIKGANPSLEDQQQLKQKWDSALLTTTLHKEITWQLRKLIGQPSDEQKKRLNEYTFECIKVKAFGLASKYIDLGADLETVWKAVKEPDAECVHWFLDRGLPRSTIDEALGSAVKNYNLYAFRRRQTDQAAEQFAVVQALINAGADIAGKTGEQMGIALNNAIQDRNMGMARNWINMGAPILDHTQQAMNRFLTKARREGQQEEAKMWESLGARQQ